MSGIRGKWGRLAGCVAAALLLPTAAPTFAVNAASDMPNLVQQWLELSRQQQQIKLHWAEEKTVLEQRLQLLEQENALLKSKVTTQQGGQSEVAQKRQTLVSEQLLLEAEQAKLRSALEFHRSQLNAVVKRLPPPLSGEWLQVIEQGVLAQQELSEAAQLQAILGLYQQWSDFQKRIVVHEAPISLGDEQVMVDQLYVGVSQAWFVSKDGRNAGIGFSSGTQWQWALDERIDPNALKTAIAMYRKQQPSEFVTLPIVQHVKEAK